MAEPKRDEEKVYSLDDSRADLEGSAASFFGERPAGTDPFTGGDAAVGAEITKLRAEKEDLLQTLVRRQADFENFRKRTERDRGEEGRRGVERPGRAPKNNSRLH